MGCGGNRKKPIEARPDQKWDYISLNDFKSTSCWTPMAYGYVYYLLILSCAVYGVDTFTAVNLLAFNNWPSQIKPAIPFEVSKWIFSICIILSLVNLAFEHIRAQRIMRRGIVVESYLDSLAVRLESIRWGKARGWRRFLVFAELTKGKKGAEYIALFTYLNFQGWFRVIFCSGPRQCINALTLWSVYNTRISATGDNVGNTILDFFNKIKILAESEPMLATVLSGMLFTLVVWVFLVLGLILSFLFWVFFLWGFIPKEDGNLTNFCYRKANNRLMEIVTEKVNKGILDEERKRKKAELKAAMKAGERPPMELKATLPDVGGDSLPAMPTLGRSDTMTTLPPYPGTPGSFEMNALDQKRPLPPARSGTMASTASGYSSRQPLVGGAADFGRSSPAPSLPSTDFSNYPPAPTRTGTMASNGHYPPGPTRTGTMTSDRSYGAQSQMSRMQSNASFGGGAYTSSPATYSSETMPALPRPLATPGPRGPQGYHRPQQSNNSLNSMQTPTRFDEYSNGRASPAPSMQSYGGNPISPRGPLGPPGVGGPGGYPLRSATNPVPPRGAALSPGPGPGPQFRQPPQRNMTAPLPAPMPRYPASQDDFDFFNNRPGTPGSQQQPPQSRGGGGGGGYGNAWNADLESQRGGTPGPRY